MSSSVDNGIYHPPEMMEVGSSNHLRITTSNESDSSNFLSLGKSFPSHAGRRTELLVLFAFHIRCCYLRRKL